MDNHLKNIVFCWLCIPVWSCRSSQLGAQFFLVCLYLFCTYFGWLCACHQEKQLYLYDTWYLLFCIDDCLVCRSICSCINLYMLQVTMCPSSGETTVSMRHLVLVILYGWLSGVHPGYLTEYGHIVTWNIYRKELDILTKFVLQVGFIYKITPSEPYCIYFLWKPQISKYCNLLILSSVLPLREFNLPERLLSTSVLNISKVGRCVLYTHF